MKNIFLNFIYFTTYHHIKKKKIVTVTELRNENEQNIIQPIKKIENIYCEEI